MFNQVLKNRNAQVMISEYVLVLFVVMAVLTSMGIYFRRAVQAKIYDARKAIYEMVTTGAKGQYIGKLPLEYEPYYTKTDSIVSDDSTETTRLFPSRYGEEYYKEFEYYKNIEMTSEVAPPKDAARPGISKPIERVEINPGF